MKKFIKNNIKVFIATIISGIIFGGVGVYATSQYFAKDISFTPTNENFKKENGELVDNVEDAINSLYNNIGSDLYTKLTQRLTNQKISKLHNGVEIQKDENNDYYFNFDGVDDYVQIETLPASINWRDGFTIEFKAKWDAFNSCSRIFDFGNGAESDNIWVSNLETKNILTFAGRSGANVIFTVPNAIINNDTALFTITLTKIDNTYNVDYYINKTLNYSHKLTTNYLLQNIERKSNYLGRSNWAIDPYFLGRIYSLKIDQADGKNIIDIDVNKIIKN